MALNADYNTTTLCTKQTPNAVPVGSVHIPIVIILLLQFVRSACTGNRELTGIRRGYKNTKDSIAAVFNIHHSRSMIL